MVCATKLAQVNLASVRSEGLPVSAMGGASIFQAADATTAQIEISNVPATAWPTATSAGAVRPSSTPPEMAAIATAPSSQSRNSVVIAARANAPAITATTSTP